MLRSGRVGVGPSSVVLAMIVAVGLAACASDPQPDATPDSPAESVEAAGTCVNQEFRAALHVDAHAGRRVWATHYDSGRDVDVRPRPPGVFIVDPNRPTILLDGGWAVLSLDGEVTKTACVDDLTGTIYIWRGDVPDPDRPPN